MSKVTERLVCRQLLEYQNGNKLTPNLQSAYRKHHSMETAVLRVVSDVLLAADRGEVTLLGLLDMSAAFDTVDHNILIDRLRLSFGFQSDVLAWITSFVENRTQSVIFNGQKSNTTPVICGVSQGSVLGPLLFLVYTADVVTIVTRLIHTQTIRRFSSMSVLLRVPPVCPKWTPAYMTLKNGCLQTG